VPRWTTETRRDPDALSELGEWWDAQPAVQQIPYLNSLVLGCWEEGFDEPASKLHLLLLRRDGDLVAGMPLYRARGRFRTLSRAHADSIDVVSVEDEEVHERIPGWLDSLPVAHLYRLREQSLLVAACGSRPHWNVGATLKSPYVDLEGGIAAVHSALSKEFARTLRRRRRRLGEMGSVTFVDQPAPQEIGSVLDAGFRLEASGWKGQQGVAVLNRPTHERWYRSLAERAQDRGWLRLSSLYLDNRLLAFRYDLEYAGSRHGLISTYDESPDVALSTGNLLLESVLEQSAERGLNTYEFGYGQHPWKYDWTSNERLVYDLLVFGSGPRGRALSGAWRVRNAMRSKPVG
jgi:CelD/BcsL family acetyltransferase involved in cellulose biosynthesis